MVKEKLIFIFILFLGYSVKLESLTQSQCERISPGNCVAVADVPGSAFGAQVWEPVR